MLLTARFVADDGVDGGDVQKSGGSSGVVTSRGRQYGRYQPDLRCLGLLLGSRLQSMHQYLPALSSSGWGKDTQML